MTAGKLRFGIKLGKTFEGAEKGRRVLLNENELKIAPRLRQLCTQSKGGKNLEDIVFVFSYSSDRNFRRKPKHLKAFGEDDE